MANVANFEFYKGEDVTVTVTMSPATAISGWTLQFTLKKLPTDATPIVTKTTGAGITITDSTNGVFTIAIASGDTSGLTPGVYSFDVQRTDSGSRTVLVIGQVTIIQEVAL